MATLSKLGNSVIDQDVGRATPKARVFVYMKDKLAGDGSGRRVFVELLGFKSVSTNLSMSGMGTATITIPNFKSALIRFISKNTIDAAKEGKEQYNDLCKSYFDFIVNDRSNLFTTLWGDTVINRGDADNNAFMKLWSRSRAELLSAGDIKRQLNVSNGLIYALPFIDVFDHIFVDYLGQDGFWYAGFTGLITRIGDSYYRTGQQSLTIQCKDYTCLLNNVSLVTAWHRPGRAESMSTIKAFWASSEANVKASVSPFANIFSNIKSVRELIFKVIDRAQDLWTMPGTGSDVGVHFGVDASGNKIKIYDTVSAEQELIRTDATSSLKEHDGVSARRWNSAESFIKPPENFRADRELSVNDYIAPKLVMLDSALYNLDNMFLHQILDTNLSVFKDSLKSASQILSQVVSQMFAYMHQDANGNLLFELAKYNAMPNFMDYGGRGSATVIRHREETITQVIEGTPESVTVPLLPVPAVQTTEKKFTYCTPDHTVSFGLLSSGKGQYLFDDGITPEDTVETGITLEKIGWYALRFHGLNYILSPTDFIGFDVSRDESTLITAVTTNALPPFMTPDSTVLQSSEWYTGAAQSPIDLMAKVGVRRFNVYNLYNVNWGSSNRGSLVLSYVSAFVLERQNAQWDSGTIQVSHRPELQLNRTFIVPLRWKSYLITGITNSWSPGGKHSTTLQVSYGHPIHQTLETPWTAIAAEEKLFKDLAKEAASVNADGEVLQSWTLALTGLSFLNQ